MGKRAVAIEVDLQMLRCAVEDQSLKITQLENKINELETVVINQRGGLARHTHILTEHTNRLDSHDKLIKETKDV